MAEISWTDEAQRWLTDIFEYIAADNPKAAARNGAGYLRSGTGTQEIPRNRFAGAISSTMNGSHTASGRLMEK